MAFTSFTRSYGVAYANYKVQITDAANGASAIVLNTSGAVLSNIGLATLDSSGNLSVILDDSRTWNVNVVDEVHDANTIGMATSSPSGLLGPDNRLAPGALTPAQANALKSSDGACGYLGTLAWASRPLTGLSVGNTARFTGIGRQVELWTWDGSRWMAPGIIILAQSAVSAPLTGTTSATILTNITIPGGCMGPNGSIRITFYGSMTNNANNKTWIVRFGTSTTQYYLVGLSNAAAVWSTLTISNRGAVGAQIGTPTGSSVAPGPIPALVTGSDNTDVDQTLQIIGILGTASDTMAVEAYKVELLQ